MQDSGQICSPLQLRSDRIDRNAYRPARGRKARQWLEGSLDALEAIHGANRRIAGCRRGAKRGKDHNPELRPAFYGDVTGEQLPPEPVELARFLLAPGDQGRDATEALECGLERSFYGYRSPVRDAMRATRIAGGERDPSGFSGRLRHIALGKGYLRGTEEASDPMRTIARQWPIPQVTLPY